MKPKYNPKNERIKKEYFRFLQEADGKSPATIDGIRKAILRLEEYTGFKDFKLFNKEQAVAFKKHLLKQKAERDGQPLCKSTILATLNILKGFIKWLAMQPEYKKRIHLPDIEYLNLTEKEVREAKTPKYRAISTLEQVKLAILKAPASTEIELRDRALMAFTILTGMRDSAIISLKLKHIDVASRLVKQDPSEVRTKFSKRIDTYFFPVGDELVEIFTQWFDYLIKQKHYSYDSPLFPRTCITHNENKGFTSGGLEPEHWQTATPARRIFRELFANAGLPYFNPHTFRNTLVRLGQQVCQTPEQFKAWSQNLGHESPLTTFVSYGYVDTYRQGEIIKNLGKLPESDKLDKILGLLEGRI